MTWGDHPWVARPEPPPNLDICDSDRPRRLPALLETSPREAAACVAAAAPLQAGKCSYYGLGGPPLGRQASVTTKPRHLRFRPCPSAQKRAGVENEGFEAAFLIMGAGTAPICLQGRLFTWWGLHTKCRFVLDWLVSTPKQLCVLLWVSCTGLPRLGRFGPSVGPCHPPETAL